MDSNIKLKYYENEKEIEDLISSEKKWSEIKRPSHVFSYVDEENDIVVGSSEVEWREAIQVAESTDAFVYIHPQHSRITRCQGEIILNNKNSTCCKPQSAEKEACCKIEPSVNITCSENEPATKDTCCRPDSSTNDTCCNPRNSSNETTKDCSNTTFGYPPAECCPQVSSCSSETSDCCHDLNSTYVHQPNAPKVKNPTLNEYKYSGEALRAVTLPIGALGGGSIAIAGDGGLRQWQISNKVCHDAHVPNSFFAIKTSKTSLLLQSDELYDDSSFAPSPRITDHGHVPKMTSKSRHLVIPAASKGLLKTLPGVKNVSITAKYPIVRGYRKFLSDAHSSVSRTSKCVTVLVDYTDQRLNDVTVSLEVFSPKIPLNSQASGAPYIVFDYKVTNSASFAQQISLLASLQNIAGWNGHTTITNQVEDSNYGGNVNGLYAKGSLYGIDMMKLDMEELHPFNGHVSIAAVKEEGDQLSSLLQYSNVKTLWKAFNSGDLPGQGEYGPSKPGCTHNGAIKVTRDVAAGQTSVFTFILGWHFPNRYKDWAARVTIPKTPVYVGNYYATVWKNVVEVVEYAEEHLAEYRDLTVKFQQSLYDSTLPWSVIDSAAGRISVLNSPTYMWHMDGKMYAFEGCSSDVGCCPLNCTHVLNFEMALSFLYPDLERTMREIDLLHQITPHGVVPSRTPCPMEIKRLWSTWTDYSADPSSTMICVDGEIGTVLKTYREILMGAPRKWFDKLWNPVKLVMRRWLDVNDTDKNGMVFGAQPNTYDVCTYGYSTMIGTLYLCALRAAEEMAKLQNDLTFASECRERFELGSKNLDEACFTNGKWYTHVMDPNHQTNVLGSCSFIGGMYGQWWAHILHLGLLLPRQHIQSHLMYTQRRNYIESFDPSLITQWPRVFCDHRDDGWIQGVWDGGEKPDHPMRFTSEIAWSGVAYPFAGLLLKEIDDPQPAIDVLERTRYLYDGTRRSPWNEIECGDHYARCMSSFALLTLASGQHWEFTEKESLSVRFNPKTGCFKGFFILPTCWGSFEQDAFGAWLHIEYGSARLSSIQLDFDHHTYQQQITVHPQVQNVEFSDKKNGKSIKWIFDDHVALNTGNKLHVKM